MGTTTKRKPNPGQAMRLLIDEIRRAIPFETAEAELCDGACSCCAKKLLEWLDSELAGWDQRLRQGEQPTLGDIDRLARSSRKIYRALEKDGLTRPPTTVSR